MNQIHYSKKLIFSSLLVCLLFPLFLLACYGLWSGVAGIFYAAIPLALLGATAGWSLLRLWEKKMRRSVAFLVESKMGKIQEPHLLAEKQQEIHRLTLELEQMKGDYEHQNTVLHATIVKGKEEVRTLHHEMEQKLEEMRAAYLEFEDLRREYQRLEDETTRYEQESQKQLKHKDSLLNEYQRTIAEQRMILEKKQRYIAKLEGKVHDLMYEIRSLLQLETDPSGSSSGGLPLSETDVLDPYLPAPSTPNTPYDFSTQLDRYIEKAETLTGVEHLSGGTPRFLDLSLEGYAVDKRPLFDNFKEESGSVVFIISLLEKKFVFVNASIKNLCGWSQEKFIKEFPQLVVKGLPDWDEALSRVKSHKACSINLSLLSKGGTPRPLRCYLGRVTKGPFANHAIGLLAQI